MPRNWEEEDDQEEYKVDPIIQDLANGIVFYDRNDDGYYDYRYFNDSSEFII